MKRIVYTVLKKLPLILAVVVAPLTLFLILHLRPEFLEFLKLPKSDDKPRKERSLEVDTATDWDKEAAHCSTAEDYNTLARKVWEAGRGSLADEYYQRALSVDRDNETARAKLGYTRFIPEQALARFNELLPFSREAEVSDFTKLQDQWLNAGETLLLKARWKETSRLLVGRRARKQRLEQSLDAAAWTELNGHGLFGKIMAAWNYRIDQTRPPFVFILEGEEPSGQEPASAFLDTLTSDLDHMLALFRTSWLPAPAKAGNENDYGTFHVFVLRDPHETGIHAVRFSKGRALQGAVSFFDEATGMLVTSLPEDKILYSGSGSNRRAMIQPFGRAIVKEFSRGPVPLWLAEGIALLLPMGSGFESNGKLRLNGSGVVNKKTFLNWIDEGVAADKEKAVRLWAARSDIDWIPWPLRLETLIACDSIDSLRAQCATDSAFVDTLEVYALFCHYLDDKTGQKFTKLFAGRHLAAQPRGPALDSLLTGLTFQSIERDMIIRYTSGRGRGAVVDKINEMRTSKKVGTATKPKRHTPAAEQIPYLGEDELLGLVRHGMPVELYRALVVYLADKHGLCPTEKLLRASLGQAVTTAGGSDLDSEWRALRESARFLDTKLGALAAAGFSHRLGGVNARLKGTSDNGLVWEPVDEGQDLTKLPAQCRIVETGDRSEATIVTPYSALPLEFAVSRFKKLLAPTTDEDRLAYCRLFIFTADTTRFRKELDSAARRGAGLDHLSQLLRLYTDAEAGAELITVLTGERSGTPCKIIEFFNKQLRKVNNKAALLDSIEEERLSAIVKGILQRTHTDGDRYLWDRFKGFEGSDEGRARFFYDFTDRTEKEDFDFRPFPLAGVLKETLRAGTVPTPRSFQVKNDSLVAYGSDFIRLEPVFAGEIEIKVSFSFAPKREKNLSKPFYFYFGCTPESGQGYVASACLKGIDLNGRLTGAETGAPGSLTCPSDLAVNKTYSATLSCSTGQVAHTFRGTRVSTPDLLAEGTGSARRGQVFVWIHGPRWFHIEEIEVNAAIDQTWLDEQIAPSVEEAFKKIMN